MSVVLSSLPTWPSYSEEEVSEVKRVLQSGLVNYWTGQINHKFEQEFAEWSGAERAVAMANGTVALDAILLALGVGVGDEVVVTPRSYFASVSSIVNTGARPVFADVDPVSQNITAATIEPRLTIRTKAIVCVHLAGWPCEMEDIAALAHSRGLAVVEDCAQAHGAIYRGVSVGNLATAAAWSFCQDKIMTTGGEGGMVTTSDSLLWSQIWSLKDHGKSWKAVHEEEHPRGFRWVHHGFGSNWRLTEMQAAIGRIQLLRMPQWHAQRKENALVLARALQDCPAVQIPMPPDHVEHAWYRFYAFVRPEALASDWSRDRIMAEIQESGVPCFVGSCPEIYLEKAFDGTDYRPAERLPIARQLGETSLAFLVHPTLQAVHMHQCAERIRAVLRSAEKAT